MAPTDLDPSLGYNNNMDLLNASEEALLEKRKNALKAQQTNNQDSYGIGSAIGDILKVAIPSLIGYQVAGYQGAEAGATGGVNAVNDAQAKRDEKDKADDALLQVDALDAQSQLTNNRSLMDKLLMGGLSEESLKPGGAKYEFQKMKDATVANKAGAGAGEIPPELVAEIAKQSGRDPALVTAEAALDNKTAYRLNSMRYATGANTKLLETGPAEALATGTVLKQDLKDIRALLPQLQQEGMGPLRALKSGQASELYKDPNSAAYRYTYLMTKIKRQIAMLYNKGALSKDDVSNWDQMTTGSPVYDDYQSLTSRLNDLTTLTDRNISSTIETFGKLNRNVSGISNLAGTSPSMINQPSPSSREPTLADVGGDPKALEDAYVNYYKNGGK